MTIKKHLYTFVYNSVSKETFIYIMTIKKHLYTFVYNSVSKETFI